MRSDDLLGFRPQVTCDVQIHTCKVSVSTPEFCFFFKLFEVEPVHSISIVDNLKQCDFSQL